jgi:alkaline phosphatase D
VDAKYAYSEFSTGPFVDANSRLGRNPGDPKSTDPEANLVIQPYTSNIPSGGFLYVKVEPEGNPWETARATFEMRDEKGVILYTTYIDASIPLGN